MPLPARLRQRPILEWGLGRCDWRLIAAIGLNKPRLIAASRRRGDLLALKKKPVRIAGRVTFNPHAFELLHGGFPDFSGLLHDDLLGDFQLALRRVHLLVPFRTRLRHPSACAQLEARVALWKESIPLRVCLRPPPNSTQEARAGLREEGQLLLRKFLCPSPIQEAGVKLPANRTADETPRR